MTTSTKKDARKKSKKEYFRGIQIHPPGTTETLDVFLSKNGQSPDLTKSKLKRKHPFDCEECGRSAVKTEDSIFQFVNGRLLCKDCANNKGVIQIVETKDKKFPRLKRNQGEQES